jgi:hypothetical protein
MNAERTQSPIIVSVSRRTDIPAFYGEWFTQRLHQGFAEYRHPFSQKVIRVNLDQEHVAGFVFWSKNFRPFLSTARMINERYPCYFHYTITGYERHIEPRVPPLTESLHTFQELSTLTSPAQVLLRYDPILITSDCSFEYHRSQFRRILNALAGMSETCIISFVQVYKKVRNLLVAKQIECEVPLQQQLDLAWDLKMIAQDCGFELLACCCPDLQLAGLHNAQCISASYFRRISPSWSHQIKKAPTRKGCGCDSSQDIGCYDTCPHGCIYCYANTRHSRADFLYRHHDHYATMLGQTNTEETSNLLTL